MSARIQSGACDGDLMATRQLSPHGARVAMPQTGQGLSSPDCEYEIADEIIPMGSIEMIARLLLEADRYFRLTIDLRKLRLFEPYQQRIQSDVEFVSSVSLSYLTAPLFQSSDVFHAVSVRRNPKDECELLINDGFCSFRFEERLHWTEFAQLFLPRQGTAAADEGTVNNPSQAAVCSNKHNGNGGVDAPRGISNGGVGGTTELTGTTAGATLPIFVRARQCSTDKKSNTIGVATLTFESFLSASPPNLSQMPQAFYAALVATESANATTPKETTGIPAIAFSSPSAVESPASGVQTTLRELPIFEGLMRLPVITRDSATIVGCLTLGIAIDLMIPAAELGMLLARSLHHVVPLQPLAAARATSGHELELSSALNDSHSPAGDSGDLETEMNQVSHVHRSFCLCKLPSDCGVDQTSTQHSHQQLSGSNQNASNDGHRDGLSSRLCEVLLTCWTCEQQAAKYKKEVENIVREIRAENLKLKQENRELEAKLANFEVKFESLQKQIRQRLQQVGTEAIPTFHHPPSERSASSDRTRDIVEDLRLQHEYLLQILRSCCWPPSFWDPMAPPVLQHQGPTTTVAGASGVGARASSAAMGNAVLPYFMSGTAATGGLATTPGFAAGNACPLYVGAKRRVSSARAAAKAAIPFRRNRTAAIAGGREARRRNRRQVGGQRRAATSSPATARLIRGAGGNHYRPHLHSAAEATEVAETSETEMTMETEDSDLDQGTGQKRPESWDAPVAMLGKEGGSGGQDDSLPSSLRTRQKRKTEKPFWTLAGSGGDPWATGHLCDTEDRCPSISPVLPAAAGATNAGWHGASVQGFAKLPSSTKYSRRNNRLDIQNAGGCGLAPDGVVDRNRNRGDTISTPSPGRSVSGAFRGGDHGGVGESCSARHHAVPSGRVGRRLPSTSLATNGAMGTITDHAKHALLGRSPKSSWRDSKGIKAPVAARPITGDIGDTVSGSDNQPARPRQCVNLEGCLPSNRKHVPDSRSRCKAKIAAASGPHATPQPRPIRTSSRSPSSSSFSASSSPLSSRSRQLIAEHLKQAAD